MTAIRRWVCVCTALAMIMAVRVHAAPQGSNITYQGQLKDGGTPVNAPAKPMSFRLYDAPSDGTLISGPLTLDVAVADGLFSAELDFGAAAFNGQQRWLEIVVDGVTLSPRQAITATPYALKTRGLSVDDIGRVGVGTDQPGAKVHATYSPLTEVGVFAGDLAPFGAAAYESNIFGGGTHAWFAENGVRVFSVMSGGNSYIGGNLGIGTTTPGFPLTFADSIGDKISLWGQSGAHYGLGVLPALLQIHTDQVGSDVAFGYGSSNEFTETLRIKGNGNVGIGTSFPSAKLSIAGTPGVDGIMFPDGTLQTTAAGLANTQMETLHLTGGSDSHYVVGWGDDNGYGTTAQQPMQMTAIATSYYFSAGITMDGEIRVWGSLDEQYLLPSCCGPYTAVAVGEYHGVALQQAGYLEFWGDNGDGQMNMPYDTYTAIAAGAYHTVGIRSDGTLAAAGADWDGQTDVPSGTFSAVAAGEQHNVAIRTNGTLAAWGRSSEGQCDVPSGTFIAVAAGGKHSLGIRTDGTLAAWGDNDDGQLNVPAGTFVAIAAGDDHNVAIRTDGTLATWGGHINPLDTPAGTFQRVAAADDHIVAIRTHVGPPALKLTQDSAFKPGTNTWTISSDSRLKKNIHTLENSLDKLLQLRGVTFDWRNPEAQGGRTATEMGMIADEVEKVFPQWVGRDNRGFRTLTIGGFEGLTAEAMRELRAEKNAQLADHQKQLDAVKVENADLRERLTRLEAALKAAGQ